MAPALINFLAGVFLGFLLGAGWMLKRRANRDGLQDADLKEIVKEDSGDPIKDADRRMAYGAYEDAAELVIGYISSRPADAQLKAKLLEIYFVWGDEEKFLTACRKFEKDLRPSRYWTQVCTMGSQILPSESLFADS